MGSFYGLWRFTNSFHLRNTFSTGFRNGESGVKTSFEKNISNGLSFVEWYVIHYENIIQNIFAMKFSIKFEND